MAIEPDGTNLGARGKCGLSCMRGFVAPPRHFSPAIHGEVEDDSLPPLVAHRYGVDTGDERSRLGRFGRILPRTDGGIKENKPVPSWVGGKCPVAAGCEVH